MAKQVLKDLVPKAYLEDQRSPDPDIQLSRKNSEKARRAPTVKKTYALPDYVARQLRLKAAKEGVTERYLVLQALKEAGVSIKDVDLHRDGRRS